MLPPGLANGSAGICGILVQIEHGVKDRVIGGQHAPFAARQHLAHHVGELLPLGIAPEIVDPDEAAVRQIAREGGVLLADTTM